MPAQLFQNIPDRNEAIAGCSFIALQSFGLDSTTVLFLQHTRADTGWGQCFVIFATECPHIITKDEWDGLPPLRVKYLIRPVELVIIEHAVSPTCMTDVRCEEVVRSMQNWHMEQLEYPDLAVSFVIGGNGNIYEGGGWLRAGNHTPGYDDKSIAISFMGNFNVDEPTQESMTAAQALIQCGVDEGHLSPDYKLVGHKQLFATGSPGKKLYKEVRTWPHWTQDVSSIKNKGKK